MAKLLLLHAPQVVFSSSRSLVSVTTALYRRPLLLNSSFTSSDSHSSHIVPRLRSRRFSARAFDDSPASSAELEKDQQEQPRDGVEEYPTGEMVYEDRNAWESIVVKFRMLFAYPWQRVRKGSVLTMTLRGQISDQLKSRFTSGLSLPQISENLVKAAYDPRIAGVYLHIEPLSCGWGKVEEIRRHILDFKKSGKFIVGYINICGLKEYYLGCSCSELYAPPSAYSFLYGLTVQASFLGGKHCFFFGSVSRIRK
ncbi:hypothetical protein DY000_02063857 [Brassica cretica]|uniref:Uncharacterized protein n=1 Tax=Brassica cretica TaxID=69181 RepID=A0ABQ7B031_BRACR|nr:hypothetical protein DY000_02063857 [Brassica cretica]